MERSTKPGKEAIHAGHSGVFQPEVLHLVKCLCKLGATNMQLAEALQRNITTIESWLTKYPDFKQAVEEGKMDSDARVQKSLYERAIGFSYDEIQEYRGKGKDGKEYSYTRKITKRVLGDVTAQIFWLTNRMRGIWQHVHRSEINVTGDINVKQTQEIDLTGFNDDEKAILKKIGIQQIAKLSGVSNN